MRHQRPTFSAGLVLMIVLVANDSIPADTATPAPTPDPIIAYYESLRRWNALNFRVQEREAVDTDEFRAAAAAVVRQWKLLGAQARKEQEPDLNRLWYQQAKLLTRVGRYKEALEALDEEMVHQDERGWPSRLSGQNRYLFGELILIEAEILGHLGRQYHLQRMDHVLLRVDVNRDGVEEFIAFEQGLDAEEFSITGTDLPAGTQRDVLYLLAVGADGKYAVRASAQVLTRAGVRDAIRLEEVDASPVVVLDAVTHGVELREGVPFAYPPRSDSEVKYRVTMDGFRELGPRSSSKRSGPLPFSFAGVQPPARVAGRR